MGCNWWCKFLLRKSALKKLIDFYGSDFRDYLVYGKLGITMWSAIKKYGGISYPIRRW
jgi:hypothetical protein